MKECFKFLGYLDLDEFESLLKSNDLSFIELSTLKNEYFNNLFSYKEEIYREDFYKWFYRTSYYSYMGFGIEPVLFRFYIMGRIDGLNNGG